MDINDYPKVKGKRFDEWEPWKGRGLPLRETCDLENPRQAFLWMFTAMPGLKGAPLPMPTEYFELLSYHQWVLGARPQRPPGLKYRPPVNMVADRWTAQGEWVGVDEPDPPRTTMADIVAKLPQQDRAELKELINNKLGVEDVPCRDTISSNINKVEDVYPTWTFSDTDEPCEVRRRRNVAIQFVAAYNKAKRQGSTGCSTK